MEPKRSEHILETVVDVSNVSTSETLAGPDGPQVPVTELNARCKQTLLFLVKVTENPDVEVQKEESLTRPIAPLPFDVLSPIFEFCGEDDWKMTLAIAAVSQTWRNAVLGTPRAWQFIDLKACSNQETVQRFIKRSGQLPLHLYFPAYMSMIHDISHRLRCLSIYTIPRTSEVATLPNLKWLSVRDYRTLISYPEMYHTRFPSLRHFDCQSILILGPLSYGGNAPVAFPPLECLSIRLGSHEGCFKMLQIFKETLVSLKLTLWNAPVQILKNHLRFSTLKYLEFYCLIEDARSIPADLETPVLETYVETGNYSPIIKIFHEDTATVKNLRINQSPPLSRLPALRRLQLEDDLDLPDTMSQLLMNSMLCPDLESIELQMAESPTSHMKEEIAIVNRHRARQIQLLSVPVLTNDLPGAIPFPSVGTHRVWIRVTDNVPVWTRHAMRQRLIVITSKTTSERRYEVCI